ncbi:MAG: HAMP domain-containing protein, partial [Methyloprofundus sp.]|nr:HAMP domain-containing protein [Methyloprofundus sp.]
MKSKKSATYSLHFTTSALFIILIIVFGGVLSWQNYRKTSEILIASGDQLFDQITSELMLDFGGIRKSVIQTVNFVALSPISQADSLTERLKSLVLLSTALANEENMSAIQIGYLNGDYFIVRHIRSEYERKIFNAPEHSVFIVDNIGINTQGKRSLLRLFYNEKLQELSRNLALQTSYDPRVRPWYKLALDNTQVVSTEPYLFYFLRKVGLTLTLKSAHGASVIAADITLGQLSNTLSRQIPTPNTEIVVFDKKGSAFIYKDINRLVLKTIDDNFTIAKLSELGSDVLSFLSKNLKLGSQALHFNFNEQAWLGAIREVQITGGNKFFVLMVSPENELLSTANKIRQQSLILTAIIILLTIPIIWFFARKISNPIRHLAVEAALISRFDFSSPVKTRSVITEVDELAKAMRMMKSTISQFLSLINSLAGEQNFDALLQRITRQTKQISQAGAALTYLYNEKENTLEPSFMHIGKQDIKDLKDIPVISLETKHELVDALNKKESSLIELSLKHPSSLNVLLEKLGTDSVQIVALPLRNRREDAIGLLCLLYKAQAGKQHNNKHIAFVQELSGFAAVSLEGRQLLMMQKALLESFIKLIADAIDSKSPYTGGHCARVPEITRLIAQAACESNAPPFQDFQLNDEQWESLHIASWLHDCGKVTTPEYVVDKSTKLETIYDRIHEIRMRVEVLKRDAEIHYWQQFSKGGDTE